MRTLRPSLVLLVTIAVVPAVAAETPAADDLARRVEELKLESVHLARDVWLFEQELGGLSGQVVVFVSADPALATDVEQVELQLGGKTIAEHAYSAREQDALRKGGAHRLYAASLEPGRHVLTARLRSRAGGGESAMLSFRNGKAPKTIELRLQPVAGVAELTVREWD